MAEALRAGTLFLTLICGFVAASQSIAPPACVISEVEQQVIRAFLMDYASGPIVVIGTTQSTGIDIDTLNLQLAVRGQGIAASALADYKSKSRTDCVIPTRVDLKRVRFITLEEENRIFRTHKGWAEFHRRYGNGASLVTVSRVGLNAEKTLALLYVTSGVAAMGGGGAVYTYERSGGKWKRKAVIMAWTT